MHALNAAVPYEILYYYYSYKIEYMLLPASLRLIGTGCTHSKVNGAAGDAVEVAIQVQGLKGICNYDEFVEHVLKDAALPDYNNGHRLPMNEDSTYFSATIDPDSSVANNFILRDPDNWILYNQKSIMPTFVPIDATEIKNPPAPLIKSLSNKVNQAQVTSTVSVAHSRIRRLLYSIMSPTG